MKYSVVVPTVIFLATTSAYAQAVVPSWVKVTDQAGWQPRDSQGELVYKNRL